ncbi:MAG: BamA/TamA family outer membrane protein [Pseudomonadota bacterium]
MSYTKEKPRADQIVFGFHKIVGGVLSVMLGLWATLASASQVILQLPPDAQGLDGHLRAASLSIETAAQDDATPQDIMAAARADYGRLTAALYQVGHYSGVISILVDGREAASISPLAEARAVSQIVIQVAPGPLFTFAEATVTPLAPNTELPEDFAAGRPAFSGFIGDAARASVLSWREAGHAKADIRDQGLTANHRNAQLSARITIDPGPRLRFGNLIVTNPGNVRPERVVEIAGLPTGEVYSPEDLQRASQRLRRTGAFSSVVLEDAETIRPVNTLDVNATLADAPPRRIGFGAELSSLEGLTLSGFWLHRNLFGGAERLRLDAEVAGIGGESGGIDYSVGFRYDRPATFTPDTSLFFSGRLEQLDEPDFRERSGRIGGGVAHIFSDKLDGELGIAYQFTDIRDAFGSRELSHILLPSRLTYDSRDVELNATEGAIAEVEFMPFVGLDNDAAGARIFLDVRSYVSLTEDNRFVFATRGQIGSVAGARAFEVPPGLLFFSGGAGTVRGQDFKSLGIPFLPGLQIGGRSFAAISAELRANITGPWGAVGFVDYAKVSRGSVFDGFTDDHAGAGFGVRYDTGLGPIRVDIATPIGSNAGENFELYVGIGQAF